MPERNSGLDPMNCNRFGLSMGRHAFNARQLIPSNSSWPTLLLCLLQPMFGPQSLDKVRQDASRVHFEYPYGRLLHTNCGLLRDPTLSRTAPIPGDQNKMQPPNHAVSIP